MVQFCFLHDSSRSDILYVINTIEATTLKELADLAPTTTTLKELADLAPTTTTLKESTVTIYSGQLKNTSSKTPSIVSTTLSTEPTANLTTTTSNPCKSKQSYFTRK